MLSQEHCLIVPSCLHAFFFHGNKCDYIGVPPRLVICIRHIFGHISCQKFPAAVFKPVHYFLNIPAKNKRSPRRVKIITHSFFAVIAINRFVCYCFSAQQTKLRIKIGRTMPANAVSVLPRNFRIAKNTFNARREK